jgi:hypothetical protein
MHDGGESVCKLLYGTYIQSPGAWLVIRRVRAHWYTRRNDLQRIGRIPDQATLYRKAGMYTVLCNDDLREPSQVSAVERMFGICQHVGSCLAECNSTSLDPSG